MARIPEAEIERLKKEIAVERLAEARGVKLQRHGADLIGLCPFHDDRQPSLVITPTKNLWHCLGACQAGGSPIDWMMRAEGVSFRHAVELLRGDVFSLAADSGVAGPPPKKSTVVKMPALLERDADDEALMRRVTSYYHATLKESPEALAYVESRGLMNAELVDTFQLGFANRTLGYRLPAKNRDDGALMRGRLQKLGVFRESGHEHFTGSIVVPIIDGEGRVVEMYGRKITAGLRKGTPLHTYLPGPHRGVWNESALAQREVVLCEALFDAMTFWCAGIRNVTAAYGIEGFTKDHWEAFRKHDVKKIWIAYDRDEAGDRAAEKLARELGAEGIETLRVLFPKGMDANEYARKVMPAEKSLALALRQATWMGAGKRLLVDVAVALKHATPTPPRVECAAPIGETAGIGGEAARIVEGDETNAADAGEFDDGVLDVAVENETIEAEEHGEQEPSNESANVVGVVEQANVIEAALAVVTEAEREREDAAARERNDDVATSERDESVEERELFPSLVTLHRVEPPSPAPPERVQHASTPPEPPAQGDEVVFRFGDRRWRARGLSKNLSYEQLRINLLLSREDGTFFVDTLEMYSARQRGSFLKQASEELGLEEHIVKRELGEVLLQLEAMQEAQIKKTLEPKDKAKALTDAEREAALALLRDPKLLERVARDFERCGVVGEETNKLVGYLAATSRKLEAPLAVVLQSSSAAGKSSLMDAVLRFLPEEERVVYSAMTGQSLFYMGEDDLRHKVLAVSEEEGAERASYALKLLQSEGELTIASTGKDPQTGRLVTHAYRVEGPVGIFLTTTAIEVDEELLNRCLVLTVDEGREQTQAIHRRQRRAQTLEGLLARQEKSAIEKVHQDAQRLLRPLAVVNPFAEELSFVDTRTRTRRDHMKYLTLIRAVTLLHQYQREVKSVEHAGKRVAYVEVTREDIALANRLADEVLGRSLDELPPVTRRLLHLVETMVKAIATKQGVSPCDVRFTRREVREHTGFGNTQLKVHLARLEELEYLLLHRGGRGARFVYELRYEGEGKDGSRFVPGLLRGYDANRSGVEEEKSAPGRPAVGGVSAPGRPAPNASAAGKNGHAVQIERERRESTRPAATNETNATRASYA